MKGPQIAASLPPKPGPAREKAILDLVKDGRAILKWAPIKVDMGPYRATFHVTAEPLMLGERWDDAFYPGVTATTMQQIADYYNAALLTPKLVDEIWKQAAVRIDPFVAMTATQQDLLRMADTATFLKHSDAIKNRIRTAKQTYATWGASPLVSNIGKYWTVSAFTSNKGKGPEGFVASENYGFFSTKKGARRSVTLIPDTDVVQTPGHRHDYAHSDYSQVVMLVSRTVELCGPTAVSGFGDSYYNCKDGSPCETPSGPGVIKCIDLYELLNDPKLAGLASHEGTINGRLPLVPFEKPESCALVALAGLGEYSPQAASFGANICGKEPPPPGPIGRGAPAGGGGGQYVPPTTGSIPRRTRPGEKGPDVKRWQAFLIAQGYNVGPAGADGDHGDKTEAASLDWERRQAGKVPGDDVESGDDGGAVSIAIGVGIVALGIGVGYLGTTLVGKG